MNKGKKQEKLRRDIENFAKLTKFSKKKFETLKFTVFRGYKFQNRNYSNFSIGNRVLSELKKLGKSPREFADDNFYELNLSISHTRFYLASITYGRPQNCTIDFKGYKPFTMTETNRLSILLNLLHINTGDPLIKEIKQTAPQFEYPPKNVSKLELKCKITVEFSTEDVALTTQQLSDLEKQAVIYAKSNIYRSEKHK